MNRYTAAENWVSLPLPGSVSSVITGLTRGGERFQCEQLLEAPEDPVPTYEEARVASKREARRAMIDDYVVSRMSRWKPVALLGPRSTLLMRWPFSPNSSILWHCCSFQQ
jgi:hypothetical protein